jgi:hypothetical protein
MIKNESILFSEDTISRLEEVYRAVYVCDSQLKTKNGWSENPVAVFYTVHPHPEGSNYFGIFVRDKVPMICNAETALEPFTGAVKKNGDIVYSRFRHDYVEFDGAYSIDGGRDYVRLGGPEMPQTVKLKIEGPIVTVVEAQEAA